MIHAKTFEFLTDLAANNNREWFAGNKARFEEAKENVISFAGDIIKELKAIDPALTTDIDPKKCVMRIYRDIRFSLDKTPYKNNFGIGKLQAGNKTENIGYYVQVQPGRCMVGGGYWMPDSAHLKLIRQEIDYNADDLKKIIDAPEFKKLFGELRDQEQLKSLPRDYDAGNENISLLRLKSFAALRIVPDKEMMQKDAAERVAGMLANIYPLTVFLNSAIV